MFSLPRRYIDFLQNGLTSADKLVTEYLRYTDQLESLFR